MLPDRTASNRVADARTAMPAAASSVECAAATSGGGCTAPSSRWRGGHVLASWRRAPGDGPSRWRTRSATRGRPAIDRGRCGPHANTAENVAARSAQASCASRSRRAASSLTSSVASSAATSAGRACFSRGPRRAPIWTTLSSDRTSARRSKYRRPWPARARATGHSRDRARPPPPRSASTRERRSAIQLFANAGPADGASTSRIERSREMRCGVSEVRRAAANPISSRSRKVGAGRISLVDAGGADDVRDQRQIETRLPRRDPQLGDDLIEPCRHLLEFLGPISEMRSAASRRTAAARLQRSPAACRHRRSRPT